MSTKNRTASFLLGFTSLLFVLSMVLRLFGIQWAEDVSDGIVAGALLSALVFVLGFGLLVTIYECVRMIWMGITGRDLEQ